MRGMYLCSRGKKVRNYKQAFPGTRIRTYVTDESSGFQKMRVGFSEAKALASKDSSTIPVLKKGNWCTDEQEKQIISFFLVHGNTLVCVALSTYSNNSNLNIATRHFRQLMYTVPEKACFGSSLSCRDCICLGEFDGICTRSTLGNRYRSHICIS